MQIVEGKQPQTEDFASTEEVADVSPRKSGHVRMGTFAERLWVLGVN
ncbi:MAG: hypothetical protein RLZZ245_3898 [Verrucomicrobiota bacterium]